VNHAVAFEVGEHDWTYAGVFDLPGCFSRGTCLAYLRIHRRAHLESTTKVTKGTKKNRTCRLWGPEKAALW